MAFTKRTIEEILNSLITEKNNNPNLAALNSTSKVAVWYNMLNAFAAAIHINEASFETLQAALEKRAAEINAGVDKWHASQSLLFQYGDSLEFLNGFVTYPIIDETKQIIKFASCDINKSTIVIKVAKADINGLAEPLDVNEFNSFEDYWTQKRFAGSNISIISQNGDKAKIYYKIGLDATVYNVANGESLLNPGVFPVNDAITSFLQSFQKENFNSKFLINKLTDAIQAVNGVKNAVPISVQIKDDITAYSEILQNENQEYLATAGWILIDSSFPLDETLTFYEFK